MHACGTTPLACCVRIHTSGASRGLISWGPSDLIDAPRLAARAWSPLTPLAPRLNFHVCGAGWWMPRRRPAGRPTNFGCDGYGARHIRVPLTQPNCTPTHGYERAVVTAVVGCRSNHTNEQRPKIDTSSIDRGARNAAGPFGACRDRGRRRTSAFGRTWRAALSSRHDAAWLRCACREPFRTATARVSVRTFISIESSQLHRRSYGSRNVIIAATVVVICRRGCRNLGPCRRSHSHCSDPQFLSLLLVFSLSLVNGLDRSWGQMCFRWWNGVPSLSRLRPRCPGGIHPGAPKLARCSVSRCVAFSSHIFHDVRTTCSGN